MIFLHTLLPISSHILTKVVLHAWICFFAHICWIYLSPNDQVCSVSTPNTHSNIICIWIRVRLLSVVLRLEQGNMVRDTERLLSDPVHLHPSRQHTLHVCRMRWININHEATPRLSMVAPKKSAASVHALVCDKATRLLAALATMRI
jgi:hypothetical protein